MDDKVPAKRSNKKSLLPEENRDLKETYTFETIILVRSR
jgi:hypothetical protein